MNTNHDQSHYFSSYLLYKVEKPSVCLSALFLVTRFIAWSLHQLTLDLHEAKGMASGIFEFISESFRSCSFSTST